MVAYGYRQRGALGIATHFEIYPRHLKDAAFAEQWEPVEYADDEEGWDGSETSTYLLNRAHNRSLQ